MTPLFRDILHATDLAPEGDPAFRAALAIALSAPGSLSIVHLEKLHGRAGHQWTGFPPVRSTLAEWRRLPAEAPASAVSQTLGLSVAKIDIDGDDLVRDVAHYLNHHPCDLVVMATHGEGPGGKRGRSHAQAIAAAVRAPSLFVPASGLGLVDLVDGRASLRQVLVPIDSRPRADAALAAAVELTRQLGCPEAIFHLLHVGPGWPMVALPPALTEGAAGRARQVRAAGPVAQTILRVADEIAADLIVMATEGRHGLADAAFGSTAEQVVRDTRRPVLTVPAL